ncbi:unnamed protein product [Rhizophagus irregularis]|nr:unnamed protein product [Rhizophagus irregularis]
MDDNELDDDFSEYIDYRNVESIEVIFGTTTSSQQRYLLSPSFVYIKLIDDDVHSIAVYFTTLEIPTRIGTLLTFSQLGSRNKIIFIETSNIEITINNNSY